MQSKKRKLQSSKGFSLSEMLVAMLILTLTISIVSGGVVVVKEAYEKILVFKKLCFAAITQGGLFYAQKMDCIIAGWLGHL